MITSDDVEYKEFGHTSDAVGAVHDAEPGYLWLLVHPMLSQPFGFRAYL